MNIKAILAKVAKGESLTDEEKSILNSFDPDTVAAAARKKAEGEAKAAADKASEMEAKLTELQEKIDNAGKTEAEKAKVEQAKIAKKLADYEARVETLAREKGEIVRGHKLAGIVGKLKFVDGVDLDLITGMLKAKFGNLKDEQLDDEKEVEAVLKGFRDSNKALLVDDSGHGSGQTRDGSNPAGGAGARSITRDQWEAMPHQDRPGFLKSGGNIKDN